MQEASIPKIRLLATDLDGTILGDAEATQRFKSWWQQRAGPHRPLLVFNSGRSVENVRELIVEGLLPQPDFIIGSVGTELWDCSTETKHPQIDPAPNGKWDLAKIEAIMAATPGVERQPPAFFQQFKSSWYLDGADAFQIRSLERRFSEAGLEVNLVYSGLRYLDVIPRVTDKGRALFRLCQRLGVALEEVVVAGDSANDNAMFLLPGVRRIVVQNAHDDFVESVATVPVYRATKSVADGVIEGFEFFLAQRIARRAEPATKDTTGEQRLQPAV